MIHLSLPTGVSIPNLGLGTWRMGESRERRGAEIAAVRTAIELGYRLIDTAEMYGEGGAEEVVGQAVAEALRAGDVRREELFIVSKVYPHNASRRGTAAACDRSRRRLGLEHIDLYLLHWRGEHPLVETVEAMHSLMMAGPIAHWGVSNFDTDDMEELARIPSARTVEDARRGCATNQVYYSLSERGPEFSLLPWLHAHKLPLMAYSPIDQGALARDRSLAAIGARHGVTAAQVALAWIASQAGVVAIPKAVGAEHLRDNFQAATLALSAEDRLQIEQRFPAPGRKTPLAMV
ncbi:aldo/keto reductase [Piscinibacter sp.]|jgi:diketogulonate reductase-like aldo/keto reductase|uniref:aldo/keto reductase n=1 Tax=Piscinibacter sp. TaxID=1903157 RepID=UPI002F3F856C